MPIPFPLSSGVLPSGDLSRSSGSSLSIASFSPSTNGEEGHIASKWASEVYLEKVARELDIPVVIHRFKSESDSTSGSSGRVVLGGLLACSLTMGVLPEKGKWEGRFDFIHSEALARLISMSAPEDYLANPAQQRQRGAKARSPSQRGVAPDIECVFLSRREGGRKGYAETSYVGMGWGDQKERLWLSIYWP